MLHPAMYEAERPDLHNAMLLLNVVEHLLEARKQIDIYEAEVLPIEKDS